MKKKKIKRNSNPYRVLEPTRCTNFSKSFILEWNSSCFGQFLCPSSGVLHCTHSNGVCQQNCMTVCTVENFWCWTEELSETCRVSFQNKNIWEISASSWFYYKKFITMHGHMNVKKKSYKGIYRDTWLRCWQVQEAEGRVMDKWKYMTMHHLSRRTYWIRLSGKFVLRTRISR
jgi:hypothetical protein